MKKWGSFRAERVPMAKCSICGNETQLNVNGTPICIACDKKPQSANAGEAKLPKPPDQGNKSARTKANTLRSRRINAPRRVISPQVVAQAAAPMKHGQRFRLTRWAVAISKRDGRNSALLIPAGAVIEVIGSPFNRKRLVDVRCDGEVIMMFTNDVEDHTELIRAETAVSTPV